MVTDLAAALQGGLGMAAAGKNVANPFAAVLTVGLTLAYLGWPEESPRLESIVARAVAEGRCTPDVGGTLGTRAVGDWVVTELGRAFG
jgi:3-isopropylmalate dehydrogenase